MLVFNERYLEETGRVRSLAGSLSVKELGHINRESPNREVGVLSLQPTGMQLRNAAPHRIPKSPNRKVGELSRWPPAKRFGSFVWIRAFPGRRLELSIPNLPVGGFTRIGCPAAM
jgi:hypothetical protein